jgi:acyl-CoA reductase-like NAD-dependent aldehyde dehydrogenase
MPAPTNASSTSLRARKLLFNRMSRCSASCASDTSPASTALIEDALSRGARISAQASVPEHLSGYFQAPTLLTEVEPQARVVQEEIFAPVAPVVTWRDPEHLLDMVNGTEMGLAA